MYPKGHVGVSLILYSPINALFILNSMYIEALVGLALFLSLSGIPDLDIKTSIVKHRGITHTVWFAFAIAAIPTIASLQVPNKYFAFAGFSNYPELFIFILTFLAVMSHIIGDMITPYGIKPFSMGVLENYKPVKNYSITQKKVRYPITRAGNELSNFIFFKLGMFIIMVTASIALLHNFEMLDDVMVLLKDLIQSITN